MNGCLSVTRISNHFIDCKKQQGCILNATLDIKKMNMFFIFELFLVDKYTYGQNLLMYICEIGVKISTSYEQ